MTLHDVLDQFEYWATYPPLNESVALYLGIKRKPKPVEFLECTRISPQIGDFPDMRAEAKKLIANDRSRGARILGGTKGVMTMDTISRLV
jgi:hypothetical protein